VNYFSGLVSNCVFPNLSLPSSWYYKLSLFSDNMILHLKDPEDTTRKLSDVINTFSNVSECKINIKKKISSYLGAYGSCL
jgi:hypothetical protein